MCQHGFTLDIIHYGKKALDFMQQYILCLYSIWVQTGALPSIPSFPSAGRLPVLCLYKGEWREVLYKPSVYERKSRLIFLAHIPCHIYESPTGTGCLPHFITKLSWWLYLWPITQFLEHGGWGCFYFYSILYTCNLRL